MSASHASQLTKPEVQTSTKKTDTVAVLRQEAQSNPVFASMCDLFVKRQRTRNQITIGTLLATMEKEGLDYSRDKLTSALAFLANLGIGRLERDRKNRISALKDIKVTLQSVGKAALSQSNEFKSSNQVQRYKPLSADTVKVPKKDKVDKPKAVKAPKVQPTKEAEVFSVTLTVVGENGKPIVLPLPNKLSPTELGSFIIKMHK